MSNPLADIKSMPEGLAKAYLEAYKLIDNDGTYEAKPRDYFTVLEGLGIDISNAQEFEDMLYGTDVDNESTIGFAEFLGTMAAARSDSPEEIAGAFEVFDRDGSGQLSRENITQVLSAFNVNMTEEELDALFKEADKDQKGALSVKEFMDAVNYGERYVKKNGVPPGGLD